MNNDNYEKLISSRACSETPCPECGDTDVYNPHLHGDLDAINNMLTRAEPYGLGAECIMWAMLYMKEQPDAEIANACEAGCYEWDV